VLAWCLWGISVAAFLLRGGPHAVGVRAVVRDWDEAVWQVRLERQRPPPASARRAPRPMDPNVAPPDTLALLPRIGPALAARIVEERGRAPFGRAEDLLRVKGIGPRTLEGVRPWLTFGGARLDTLRSAPLPSGP
jgi:DNA uptake protein ComE-like DNA-binding protein